MKNTFLWKILIIVMAAVLLCSGLTILVFNYTGRAVFSMYKANELVPRAEYLSLVTAEYMQGYIGDRDYERALAAGYYIWDAQVYVFNEENEQIVRTGDSGTEDASQMLTEYVGAVLSGDSIYYSETPENRGVIVGEPVTSRYGNVIGAVFLVKPLREVNAALQSLNLALTVSMLGALAIMVLPVYFISRRTTDPLRQMTHAANAMARGDFSVRADCGGRDETAQLGNALNYLSTELSRTIDDLVIERNRLKAIVDGMREGLLAFDEQGKIIRFNPAAIRLLGGAEDDIASLVKKYGIDEIAEKDVAVRECEFAVNDMVIHAAASTLLNHSGAQEGCVVLLRDITEAVRLEQTRRDYVANVSHELRTPIAAIRGLADALNDGMVHEQADKDRYYGYILHETLRLSRLIDDLLELSRLQSKTAKIDKQPVIISELAGDVAERYASAAAEQGRRIVTDIPDSALTAFTNPDRAEEVLVILVDNAINHAVGEGDIGVIVEDTGEIITVRVENPGNIESIDLPHVFERFYKADRSHSGNGTGLGLSIAYEVIDAMGEKIWAHSGEGRVSFGFTLQKMPQNMENL